MVHQQYQSGGYMIDRRSDNQNQYLYRDDCGKFSSLRFD